MNSKPYLVKKSIWEYIEANKRIHLSLFCPALRIVGESSSLHIETLMICARFIKINNQEYRDRDSLRGYMEVDRSLEMIFRNQKSVIFVKNLILDVMESQRFGKVRLNAKIRPTNFSCQENKRNDVIFGENTELFCTLSLRKLKIHTFDRPKDLYEHPILPQLSHLEIDRSRAYLPFTNTELSALPIPHLTICDTPDKTTTTLVFWIRRKIRNRKFSIRVILPHDVINRMDRTFNLRRGIFDWRNCWILYYDDEVGIECVLTVDEEVNSFFRARFTINLQILPVGSAIIGDHWRHLN